jgi:hypothetical protein
LLCQLNPRLGLAPLRLQLDRAGRGGLCQSGILCQARILRLFLSHSAVEFKCLGDGPARRSATGVSHRADPPEPLAAEDASGRAVEGEAADPIPRWLTPEDAACGPSANCGGFSCMNGLRHQGRGASGSEGGSVAVAANDPMNSPPNSRALKASFMATPGGLGIKARATIGCERAALPPKRPAERPMVLMLASIRELSVQVATHRTEGQLELKT